MKKLNKKGFSVLEVILILLVVSLIAGLGYMVYQNKGKSKAQISSTTNDTTTPTTAEQKPAADQFFAIKEWGVQIPKDKIPTGFSYSIAESTAKFRSKALDDLSVDKCTSNSIYVVRGKATDTPPSEGGSADNFQKSYDVLVKEDTTAQVTTTRDIHLKLGDYYYIPPGYSGATCLTAASTSADQTKEEDAMLEVARAVGAMQLAQ
jgi:hypothetical protein